MKFGKFGVLTGIMLIGLLVVLSGCELGGDGPDYRIEFTIADTEYVFTAGYTSDPDNVAEGCETSSGDSTRLIAEKAEDASKYVSILLEGTDTGTYEDSEIIFSTTVFAIHGLGHSDTSISPTDFDLTVTEYGPVGGVICGTFSGNVEDWDDPHDVYALTEGYFCVKRQEKGAIVLK